MPYQASRPHPSSYCTRVNGALNRFVAPPAAYCSFPKDSTTIAILVTCLLVRQRDCIRSSRSYYYSQPREIYHVVLYMEFLVLPAPLIHPRMVLQIYIHSYCKLFIPGKAIIVLCTVFMGTWHTGDLNEGFEMK